MKKLMVILSLMLFVTITPQTNTLAGDDLDGQEACNTCQQRYDEIMDQCPYKETDPYDPQCVAAAEDARLQCQLLMCIY